MNLHQTYPMLKIIRDLAKAKKADCYLVGGFLRDHFLNKSNMDLDFAVSTEALKFARSFARKIKGTYVLLDKERGCARVCKKDKGVLATYDFADFRAKTFKGDLKRRDFTINTLAICLSDLSDTDTIEGALITNLAARKDLSARRIRMVSPKAFSDDPLRILRAYSLSAQHHFKIESKTLAQMKRDRKLLAQVSAERLRDELFKVLSSENCGKHLARMDKDGILELVLPQIRIMDNCKQGTYHHLDVWPHSLETVHQLDMILRSTEVQPELDVYLKQSIAGERRRLHIMRLAALLHDVGKPETRKLEKGRVSFHGHEHVGKRIIRHVAKQLKLSTKERHMLEDMVLWHLRPGYLSNFKKPSERMIYRYLRDTGEEAVAIALFSLADQRSTRGPATTEHDQEHHEKICLSLVELYFLKLNEKPLKRLISGHDLIRQLKLKPSPLFSRILTTVEEKQTLGEITTKEQALALAERMSEQT